MFYLFNKLFIYLFTYLITYLLTYLLIYIFSMTEKLFANAYAPVSYITRR